MQPRLKFTVLLALISCCACDGNGSGTRDLGDDNDREQFGIGGTAGGGDDSDSNDSGGGNDSGGNDSGGNDSGGNDSGGNDSGGNDSGGGNDSNGSDSDGDGGDTGEPDGPTACEEQGVDERGTCNPMTPKSVFSCEDGRVVEKLCSYGSECLTYNGKADCIDSWIRVAVDNFPIFSCTNGTNQFMMAFSANAAYIYNENGDVQAQGQTVYPSDTTTMNGVRFTGLGEAFTQPVTDSRIVADLVMEFTSGPTKCDVLLYDYESELETQFTDCLDEYAPQLYSVRTTLTFLQRGYGQIYSVRNYYDSSYDSDIYDYDAVYAIDENGDFRMAAPEQDDPYGFTGYISDGSIFVEQWGSNGSGCY